jgi:hypothetical protein
VADTPSIEEVPAEIKTEVEPVITGVLGVVESKDNE